MKTYQNDYQAIMNNSDYCRIVKANNQTYLFYYGELLNLKRTWKNEFKKKQVIINGNLECILKNSLSANAYKVYKSDKLFKEQFANKLKQIKRQKSIEKIIYG